MGEQKVPCLIETGVHHLPWHAFHLHLHRPLPRGHGRHHGLAPALDEHNIAKQCYLPETMEMLSSIDVSSYLLGILLGSLLSIQWIL